MRKTAKIYAAEHFYADASDDPSGTQTVLLDGTMFSQKGKKMHHQI